MLQHMISFRTETSNVGNTINAYKKVDLWGGYHIYIYTCILSDGEH